MKNVLEFTAKLAICNTEYLIKQPPILEMPGRDVPKKAGPVSDGGFKHGLGSNDCKQGHSVQPADEGIAGRGVAHYYWLSILSFGIGASVTVNIA